MESQTLALSRRTVARLALPHVYLFLASGFATAEPVTVNAKLRSIKHIIVIYKEHWSFDSLYEKFPGANGIAESSAASLTQTDRSDDELNGQSGMPFSLVS